MSETVVKLPRDRQDWIASARRAIEIETKGLVALRHALEDGLGSRFADAVEILRNASGRVICSGVGKSGHVARKIAATMASTGTPAMFVHATEASHGDLGMITSDDVLVMLSNSGETVELKDVLAYSRRFSVPVIAITGKAKSALGKAADVVLELPRAKEACSIGLAPTTSTTLQMALGDALAIALLDDRGFTATDYQKFHPGGRLGAALTMVRDVMHGGDSVPLVTGDVVMSEALLVMTDKSFGCVGIINAKGLLIGIITDGDLRRHMSPDLLKQRAEDIMTPNPVAVGPDELAFAALEKVSTKISSLFVVEDGKPVGIIHVHDLLQLGVK
jgi:arabinose-5-phosphate isomerase